MIEPSTIVYIAALIFMAVCSTAVVLWTGYHDNFTQRVGLSLVALGACGEIFAIVQNQGTTRTVMTLFLGVLLFGVGTWFKVRKQEFSHD